MLGSPDSLTYCLTTLSSSFSNRDLQLFQPTPEHFIQLGLPKKSLNGDPKGTVTGCPNYIRGLFPRPRAATLIWIHPTRLSSSLYPKALHGNNSTDIQYVETPDLGWNDADSMAKLLNWKHSWSTPNKWKTSNPFCWLLMTNITIHKFKHNSQTYCFVLSSLFLSHSCTWGWNYKRIICRHGPKES